MASGILVIDKPTGWTSQDVAAKLRGVFHERRVGHGGTLDPMATGVLPVFVGRATRAAEFTESAEKEYLASFRPGLVTDTQDITGSVLSETHAEVSEQALSELLPRFLGEQDQLPPMYSAVKIGGRKLYELARRGQEVERAPRRIVIHELALEGRDGGDFLLRVRCSKGTYVRTLLHDIGQVLGTGGCMSALRRTRAGSFTLRQAVTMPELLSFAAEHDPAELLMPPDAVFSDCPVLIVTLAQAARLKNGAQVTDWHFQPGTYRVYAEDGEFLLLGRVDGAVLTTVKSFFEVNRIGT